MKSSLVILALLISTLKFNVYPTAHAEEGMFFKDQIPYETINTTYPGVNLTPDKINKISKSVFKISIGGGGGSGSFISPDGLVLTNHHVAYDCVQDLRQQGKLKSEKTPFASDFFFAKGYDTELPCQQYELHISQDISDVTSMVVPQLPTGDFKLKKDALEKISKQLVSICEGLPTDLSDEAFEKEQERLTTVCELTSLSSIEKFFLEKRTVIRDVRLVYAPSKDIASLGQDALNFQYPRHAADFAFLRAYGNGQRRLPECNHCSPVDTYGEVKEVQNKKGQPESRFFAHASNKPLDTSTHYLSPAITQPIQENEYVMIMGFPGGTTRLRDHNSIDFRINYQHPFEIAFYQALEHPMSARIAKLENTTDPTLIEEREGLKSDRASIMNSIQASQGMLGGLIRTELLQKKIELDQRLEAAIASNEKFKQGYGHVLPTMSNIYQDLRQANPTTTWLGNISRSGIFGIPSNIVTIVEGLDPNSGNPAPDHIKPKLEKARTTLIENASLQPIDKDISIRVLSTALEIAKDKRYVIPLLNAVMFLISTIPGLDLTTVTSEALATFIITSALDQSRIFSDKDEGKELRKKLLHSSLAQLRESQDPLIVVALKLKDTIKPEQEKFQRALGQVLAIRTQYGQALKEVLGEAGMNYYDANFTQRFTYGSVKGYQEKSGNEVLSVAVNTNFFDIPNTQLNGAPLLKVLSKDEIAFCEKAGKVFGNQPVNFISTTDITGGNSGSAVINKDLKVVGTAFDSNWVGIVQDYTYDNSSGRTVSVSLPFAIQVMNMDVAGGMDVAHAIHTPNRISQELENAENGKGSYIEPPKLMKLPVEPAKKFF